MLVWSRSDEKFLKSLRIASDNPPDPLPRFRVEVGQIDGEYQVIDTEKKFEKKFKAYIFGKEWPNPREAAIEFARHYNAPPASADQGNT